MLGLEQDKLVEYFEKMIMDLLGGLVNPYSAVLSVPGETEGVFGYDGWEIYTGSKLIAISTAVSIIDANEEAGNDFCNGVFDYIKNNIKEGVLSFRELESVDDVVSSVSNCTEGSAAKAMIYNQLKDKGFYDDLKPVYATLEILVSMAVPVDLSLPFGSKEELKTYLVEKIELFEKKLSDYKESGKGYGMKFNRARYNLNKYSAILDNLDLSFQNALDLLDGLDLSLIRQVIIDNDISYLKL
ncbi:MAG: hypothetical protein GQ477_04050 [Nanohaloarchaea archaeon]|nr:hypothetical protein [Candidatus Nanohaloarchaea archaeon]